MVLGLEEVGVVEVVNQEKGHWDPGEYCRLQKGKEGTFSFARGDKNLAEPRTSQGVFGPNGVYQLVRTHDWCSVLT